MTEQYSYDKRSVSTDADVEQVSFDIGFEIVEGNLDQTDAYNYGLHGEENVGLDRVKELFNKDWNSIPVTELEIVRPAGMGGSMATIKAYVDDTTGLEYVTDPYVQVRVKIKLNGAWQFTGTLIRVTQNDKGIVTFEAMDARRQLLNHTVRLDLRGKGAKSGAVLRDLLIKEGPFAQDEVLIGLPEEETIKASFGENRRAPLRDVLKYILHREHAFAYITSENNIIISMCPPVQELELSQITSFNAGSEQSTNTTVIAEAPQADSQLNFNGAHQTASSVTRGKATKGGDTNKKRLIKDNVSKSVQQSTNQAVDAQFREDFMNDLGKITVAGDARITPYDRVTITEADVPNYASMTAGTYSVKEVKHKVSPRDGFVTDVSLSRDLGKIWRQISDTQNVAKTRLSLFEKIKNSFSGISYNKDGSLDQTSYLPFMRSFL